ncbi:MAG TPA: M56 family metallopeptidase [Gemmatimonadaceae bacterium]|jgi:beta-lactamase regulating signal transducer with metallopeptidase domain|nr:M56 family metallopeptidase [Gemmatimonadaceae bacterium]
MLCILYVNLVGLCLGLAALFFERALPPGWPRRWLWCLVIPISVALPGMYRFHHAWSVADVFVKPATVAETLDTSINRVWLTTSALLVLWGLVSAWQVSRLLWLSRKSRNADGMATIDGVPVVVTDTMGPATVGFWRSRVLLPRWVLTLPGEEQQYVVRHEEEHRRAQDGRLLFVMSLPLLLMPWNLAMWWQIRRLCLAVEMDCDNRVVNRLGDATAYGELLLKVAQATSGGPRLQPAFLGGVGTLERRLTALLAPTPLRHVQRFLLPAAAFGLVVLVALMPHPVLGKGPHAHSAHATQAAR